jgi:hypothetical protein
MEQFKVHNGARDPETRTLRASNAQHRGLKLFIPIGQQRVLRGRPVIVTEAQIQEKLEEMRALQASGLIYVTTMDERVVDLFTGAAAPVPAEPPRPNPPLDDARRDPAGGQEPLSAYNNEAPPPATFEMPVAPPMAAFDDPAPLPRVAEESLENSLEDAAAAEEEVESSSSGMPNFSKPTNPPPYKKKGR